MRSALAYLNRLEPYRSAFKTERKTLTGGLLEKCGVMEALNRHERFILESSIIPFNAYPFVY